MNSTSETSTATTPRFRNIHFAGVVREAEASVAAPAESATRRRRWVQRSPQEEFATRAGECEPLAGEIASLILFRKEKLTCGRDGLTLKIKTDGEGRETTRKYWHENSLCCQPSWLGREVFAAYNRHDPLCLYIFSADGELIEAIPEKGQDEWFGQGKQLEAHCRHQAHALARLEHLHGEDSDRAVATAAGNTAQMLKVVQTFTPGAQAPGRTPGGEHAATEPSHTRDTSPARDSFGAAHAIAAHHDRMQASAQAVRETSPGDILARRAARAEAAAEL